jgi:hypothetical protein
MVILGFARGEEAREADQHDRDAPREAAPSEDGRVVDEQEQPER